ncbi:MAG: anti-sigma factor family protein [Syntrophomonadaceae bacterium]|jgi:hypothetical protein
MNCQQVDKYIFDYCDNILNPDRRAELELHLETCVNCQKLVNEALLESSILREEFYIPSLPDDFTCQVINRVKSLSGRECPIFLSQVIPPKKYKLSSWFLKRGAITAGLLAILFISGMLAYPDFIKIANYTNDNQYLKNSSANTTSEFLPLTEANPELPIIEQQAEKPQTRNKYSPVDTLDKNDEAPPLNRVQENIDTIKQEKLEEEAPIAAIKNPKPDVMLAKELNNIDEVIPVQPINLPADYMLIKRVDNDGYSTYTYGTSDNCELIIDIAFLPLSQQATSNYSRGNSSLDTIQTPSADNTDLPNLTQEKVISNSNSSTEEKAFDNDETIKKESESLTIETEHNGRYYLITINADLSPEELDAISKNLKIVEFAGN